MDSKQIRQKYIEFFKTRQHALIPSASLIPENDSTLLFVNSGMFPLVPYLLGAKHPAGDKLVNSQKSFRTEDIDEVGDNRHNTFFEMLGNWSLGTGYWKSEQLNWWFEFLVDELKLDPKRLYQTIYAGSKDGVISRDTESEEIVRQIFNKYGVDDEDRIFEYIDKNWWQRGDAVGELGGPDSETFYDTGKIHDPKFGEQCHINCDCGRYIEIGNSVFMQYQKTENGWKELASKNVDFGGGLERLSMVSQEKNNIFETDLFSEALKELERISAKQYKDNNKAFEIILDHLKAATFIMGDEKGIGPSNTDQGYIVRRLIRRAIRFGRQIGISEKQWTRGIAEIYINQYRDIYPELNNNKGFIISELDKEESKFQDTLEKGIERINKLFKDYEGGWKEFTLTADILFDLYQSFGFPFEMSIEEINNKRVANMGIPIPTEVVSQFYDLFKLELEKHQDLSRTASAGKFKGGLADHSVETTRLHTASHLLLAALRKVLGEGVSQRGSNITAERLRFDFPYPEKMTSEQIAEVERLVNEAIEAKLPVHFEEMPIEQAREIGATGVFDSKYGERVKVYFMGDFSKEICGGPHVENTGELGHFRIAKEESSSSGIRRIRAVLE